MEQILKTLQEIQLDALKMGVSSFHLDIVRTDDGNFAIATSVRLRDDGTDGDYLSETFYPYTFGSKYKIERIKAFINSLN